MLKELQDRVILILATTQSCTLSTNGPAGLQASVVYYVNLGIIPYLYIPDSSDHLFNLEHQSSVVLTTKLWQLYGTGIILNQANIPAPVKQRPWHMLIQVLPAKMHIDSGPGSGRETIDFATDEQ